VPRTPKGTVSRQKIAERFAPTLALLTEPFEVEDTIIELRSALV
jgi:hypothetical protein